MKELRAEEWYEESPFESVSDSQTCNATPRVLQPSNATPQPSNATPQPTPPCALTKKIDTIMCTEKMKGGKAVRAAAAGKRCWSGSTSGGCTRSCGGRSGRCAS